MIASRDPAQSDLKTGEVSGLNVATRVLNGLESAAIVRFTGADVVRHPLVQRIVDAYERDDRGEAEAAGDELGRTCDRHGYGSLTFRVFNLLLLRIARPLVLPIVCGHSNA